MECRDELVRVMERRHKIGRVGTRIEFDLTLCLLTGIRGSLWVNSFGSLWLVHYYHHNVPLFRTVK